MTRPRVVITGIGGVTPLANDIESTWKKLLAGESGIAPITLFDASAYDSRIAGEVKNFVAEDYMPMKQARRMDRFTQFAVASAKMLLEDSKYEITDANAYDTGVRPNSSDSSSCSGSAPQLMAMNGLLLRGLAL